MADALLDINIVVWLCLLGVFLLGGLGIARHSPFFRGLVDARLADPDHESHLEGLRGVLAFGVFVHHAAYTWEGLNHGGWYEYAPGSHFLRLLGSASVSMFFFLTGYLFWSKFLKRESGRLSVSRFYWRRLLRIGPAYWLYCLTVTLIVIADAGWASRTTITEWSANIAQWVVFGLPLGDFPDLNGYSFTRLINADVAWTLRHEALFYLLLPLLLPFARHRRTLVLVLMLVCTLAASGLVDSALPSVPGPGPTSASMLHRLLADGLISFNRILLIGFVPGMLTAYVLHRPGLQALVGRIEAKHARVVVVICVLMLLLNTDPRLASLRVFPLGVVFLLIAARKVGVGLLRSRGLMVTGAASYSVYLLHGLFLFMLEPRGLNLYAVLGRPGIIGYWMLVGCLGLAILSASALVYRFVEHPAMAFARRGAATA